MGNHQKLALLSASLGDYDPPITHALQTVKYDHHLFTDTNFPPRYKSFTPRMQAKIPKCFGWQLVPGYEVYVWLDGNLTMTDQNTLKYFLDALAGHDVVVLRHPRRNTIHWEYRYNYRGLKEKSLYLSNRYDGEWLDEQMKAIAEDKHYVDDMLVLGGVIVYRNKPEVQAVLKEWWYHMTRYLIMDQLSWSYVLKKSGLKVNVLPDAYNDCRWLSHRGHKKRA